MSLFESSEWHCLKLSYYSTGRNSVNYWLTLAASLSMTSWPNERRKTSSKTKYYDCINFYISNSSWWPVIINYMLYNSQHTIYCAFHTATHSIHTKTSIFHNTIAYHCTILLHTIAPYHLWTPHCTKQTTDCTIPGPILGWSTCHGPWGARIISHCTAVPCNKLNCTTLPSTVLPLTALYCNALH